MRYPISAGAPIEGGPNADSERLRSVVSRGSDVEVVDASRLPTAVACTGAGIRYLRQA
jgi:hypothetical protein